MVEIAFYKRFSENLREELKSRDLKESEMAEIIGMDPVDFAAKLACKKYFTLLEAFQIADECLMKVDDFFGEVKYANPCIACTHEKPCYELHCEKKKEIKND